MTCGFARGQVHVGQLLAERLGVGYRDTDNDNVTTEGPTIADIFVEEGKPVFRVTAKGRPKSMSKSVTRINAGSTACTRPSLAAPAQLHRAERVAAGRFCRSCTRYRRSLQVTALAVPPGKPDQQDSYRSALNVTCPRRPIDARHF
ncbi:shikimate kinase [Streptomyces sp. TP-A0356]|uniref:shikimate kinase n=1 Tax=Streptomyces sp. TP-A0356 TaxID=1359208 RepID=UPI00099EC107|nr:shikimate kinase [Streptomyces sp. TP-A0356]